MAGGILTLMLKKVIMLPYIVIFSDFTVIFLMKKEQKLHLLAEMHICRLKYCISLSIKLL